MRPRAALTAAVCLCLALPALAAQDHETTVHGVVTSSQPYDDFFVQLIDSHRAVSARAEVQGDGSFEFSHVSPGDYILRVVTAEGDTVCERQASVGQWEAEIDLRVPDAPRGRAAGAAGTVSVKQLLHPPSKKAFQSFAAAQKFSSSGDYAKATTALERAVAESPDYAEAHVNLGVEYIRGGHLQQAEAEFRRALDIAGPFPAALCNLAWVQARTGHRDQALETVRAGLRLDQSSPQGHLILGALLAQDPRTRDEAILHLTKAAETLKSARDFLAGLQPR
ncbi:MAG: tetratricopeptide repeat protein [Acidobacteria bacterium]|nr:tetratricopeptide repeat protein [Acidobacteriota bacterium]